MNGVPTTEDIFFDVLQPACGKFYRRYGYIDVIILANWL